MGEQAPRSSFKQTSVGFCHGAQLSPSTQQFPMVDNSNFIVFRPSDLKGFLWCVSGGARQGQI